MNVFELFLIFFPMNGPHKTTFGIFEIWKIQILMNFLALLDCVSRAYGMGFLSVVRVAIISEHNARFSFKFNL